MTAPQTTATQTTATDPRPGLRAAMDQLERVLAATPADRAADPTPCAEYDVEGLVAHLQAVIRRIGAVLAGRSFDVVPHQLASSAWMDDWRASRAESEQVLEDDACLTRDVLVPWGQATGAQAVGAYIGELTVHAWDLARAIGREDLLADALALAALEGYRRQVPAQPRGGPIPFGPVVEAGEGATAYQRLAGWTGRDPLWTPGT